MRFDKSILHLPWYKLYLSYLQRATTKKVVAHTTCGEWCKRKNSAKTDDGKYWPESTYRVMKTRVLEAISQELTDEALKRIHHTYDTQLCEALQGAVSYHSPKNRTYCQTVSLYSRVSHVAGIHNWGVERYCSTMMETLGIDLPETSLKTFVRVQTRKMNKAVYESTPAVKYRRKIMEHERMKEEKAKDAKQRASYGKKIERDREKKPSAACVTCGLYKHTNQNNRLCLGNASHRLHKIFNKDPLEAIVLHAEEYVQLRGEETKTRL